MKGEHEFSKTTRRKRAFWLDDRMYEGTNLWSDVVSTSRGKEDDSE